MALSALRTPNPPRAAAPGEKNARSGDPFGDEAKAFTRQHLLQRTVEVGACFVGVVCVHPYMSMHWTVGRSTRLAQPTTNQNQQPTHTHTGLPPGHGQERRGARARLRGGGLRGAHPLRARAHQARSGARGRPGHHCAAHRLCQRAAGGAGRRARGEARGLVRRLGWD